MSSVGCGQCWSLPLTDLAGTSDLTEAVGEVLSKEEGGGLRDLWIAGQRNRADLKLKGTIRFPHIYFKTAKLISMS